MKTQPLKSALAAAAGLVCIFLSPAQAELRLAVFDVDATPPIGSAMAYDPVKRLDELTLRCRGIVLLGSGAPMVLCAVDWIGIANEGHDHFRSELAKAAGTVRERVAVHALHQHDAPGCDFTAEKIVQEMGVEGYTRFDGTFHRAVIRRAAEAIRAGIRTARPVTHYGYGEATVREVASNRRVETLPDGRIGRMRGSSCRIPELRALPDGVIDPVVSVLSFWEGDKPLALLSSYACHPQSYYRLGIPSPDFPGIARFIRGQELNGALHVHFNGAGGNVAAGKYNDGSQPNRMLLSNRLADGMREAFEKGIREPLQPGDVGWASEAVRLPVAVEMAELEKRIRETPPRGYISCVDQLAWARWSAAGHAIDVTCLRVGGTKMLHLPGELFVEYQLDAKRIGSANGLRGVLVAAYGQYGPGYIGTAAAYRVGGYELAPGSTSVDEQAEPLLKGAIERLLKNAP